MSSLQDLYQRLELDPSASSSDIKKSYRRLAMKYHPDKNKDPEATQKFQEISMAYEILSDPQKVQQYQRANFSQFNSFSNIFAGIFSLFRVDFVLNTDYEDLIYGSSEEIQFVENIFVNPEGEEISGQPCGSCHGRDAFMNMLGIKCSFCQGRGKIYSFSDKMIEKKITLQVQIPPKSWPDRILDIQGKRIKLNPMPRQNISHHGLNIIYVQELDIFSALLGFEKNLKILGKNYNVRYEDPIQPGTELTLPEAGLYGMSGQRGQLIIHFDVIFPQKLTETQKKYLKRCL